MRLLVITIAILVTLAGCAGPQRVPPIEIWPDMRRDGKYKPQAESKIFGDGRASRIPVKGTVARGYLDQDEPFFSGIAADGETYIGQSPVKIDMATMKVGQAKFNTFCSPCHSRVGDGRGIVALRTPSWQPANLHDERILLQSDGEIFHTIGHGKNSMPGYRFQMIEKDRWAIVAYVRAIQRARNATAPDVPADLQAGLK